MGNSEHIELKRRSFRKGTNAFLVAEVSDQY